MASKVADTPMLGASDGGEGGHNNARGKSSGGAGKFWGRASKLEKILIFTTVVLIILLIIFLVLYGLSRSKSMSESDLCLTPACVTVAATVLSSLDQSVDPCTDFYQFSCGGWIKSNPLPDGKSDHGSLGSVWEKSQVILKRILEDENFELKSEAERKARTCYEACMNQTQIEHLGARPILNVLKKVGGWNISGDFNINQWSLQKSVEVIHNHYNGEGLFSWFVGEDKKNSSRNIIHVQMNGLLLPSTDLYINKTKDDEVLSAYLTYMTEIGVLLGGEEKSTRAQMEDVLDFEIELAKISSPAEQLDQDQYVGRSLKDLAPIIDWQHYFNAGFKFANEKFLPSHLLIIDHPKYMLRMSELVTKYLSTTRGRIIINNYLMWNLMHGLSSFLSTPFQDASDILNEALTGTKEAESQWRTCVKLTDGAMGFALGTMYIRETFHSESKPVAEKMINEIRDAFEENLPMLEWMDSETRELAKEKAEAITNMIGYPDFILDPEKLDEYYRDLVVKPDEYFLNNVRNEQYERIKNVKKLSKLTDPTEWSLTPPQANAYYSPSTNQIVFPAGILIPPFYDPQYPKYMNYGGIGSIMGHELTHAFDDQGRQYDKFGNMRQWWKNSTIKSFRERAQCVIDQYNSYTINGEHLNGNNTLDDNIADNGGLKAAFHAYQNYIKTDSSDKPLPGVPLTNNQLLFVAFAQVWCSVTTPEAVHLEIVGGDHSIERYRTIGSVSNSEDFAREFKCPPNSPMNPVNKCEVW